MYVRGVVLELLFWSCCCLHTLSVPIAYHALSIFLPFATSAELTAKCEGSRFGVAAVCIHGSYLLLTMSLPFSSPSAACAELITRCEGNRLGVSAICVPCSYHLLHAQN